MRDWHGVRIVASRRSLRVGEGDGATAETDCTAMIVNALPTVA